MSDSHGVIFLEYDEPGDSVSPFEATDDTEQDSPVWLSGDLEELKGRHFQRVNDSRVLILTEIVAL